MFKPAPKPAPKAALFSRLCTGPRQWARMRRLRLARQPFQLVPLNLSQDLGMKSAAQRKGYWEYW